MPIYLLWERRGERPFQMELGCGEVLRAARLQ